MLNLNWSQSTTSNNETTGYFKFVASGAPAPVGPQASDNKKYIALGGLVKFIPPAGQYFTATNRLAVGSPTLPGDKTILWATVTALELDGTNQGVGNNADGTGPVTLNNFIPTNAVPTEVIPNFVTDLPTAIETTMRENIELYRDFGLGYDNLSGTWYIITSTNLNAATTFSLVNAQNTSGTGLDNSWLVAFETDGVTYTVSSRSLQRFWASVLETRFFYDGTQKVYDPKTGTVINDFINVLKTNNKPDTSSTLNSDEILDIIDQPVEADGFVDNFRVRISYKDSDNDGIPDNPDYFKTLVAPTVNPNTKRVYLQQSVDFDNLERYLPLASGVVIDSLATKSAIELVKSEYTDKQVFYAYTDKKFYQLTVDYEGTRTIAIVTGYQTYVGRQGLYFQYRHNAP